MLRALVDFLYPSSCLLCGETPCPPIPFFQSRFFCEPCNPRQSFLPSDWLLDGIRCELCGDPVEGEEIQNETAGCLNCRLFPLPGMLVRSLWRYSEPVEAVIKRYKYGGCRALAPFFSAECASAIRRGAFPPERRWGWNLIVPVPSTSLSLGRRGYGHVAIVAQKLARDLKIPSSLSALNVTGKHPAQASLRGEDRLKHLHRKFVCAAKYVQGKTILLLDDVITSGASALGSALALRAAGARSVDILSFARTEQFTRERRQLAVKIEGRTKHTEHRRELSAAPRDRAPGELELLL